MTKSVTSSGSLPLVFGFRGSLRKRLQSSRPSAGRRTMMAHHLSAFRVVAKTISNG